MGNDKSMSEILSDIRRVVAEDEKDSRRNPENTSPDEILDEVRGIATEGQETDAQAAQGREQPPNLIERGVAGWCPGLALAVLGILFSLRLQEVLIEALAIPTPATLSADDGLFVSWFFWAMILTDARPSRAGQWLAIAAISVLYFAVAVLAWAGAAALVFHLVPEQEFGTVTVIVLGIPAAMTGWAAFWLIHRSAGRASPWREGSGARGGAG